MGTEKSPYDTPESELTVHSDEIVEIHTPVGRWIRLANFVIDYVAMIAMVGLLFSVAGLILGEAGVERLVSIIDSTSDVVFGMGMYLFYYLPLEAVTARTLGKLVTGTKIVTEEGAKPAFLRIVGRTLSRLVPLEPFSFLGKEGRGWHDTWPGIYVVKCR